jgi:hypothetical protein
MSFSGTNIFSNRIVITLVVLFWAVSGYGHAYAVEPAAIVASKIVCADEADLPNWGSGGPDITASTATDWVAGHAGCSFVPGWSFQWSYDYVANPGDNVGEVGGDWNTFGPTNASGVATTEVSDLGETKLFWIREIFRDGYIPFTYAVSGNDNDVTAELYCADDVENYDNYDLIDSPRYGGTYYCVGWNVGQGSVTVTKWDDADADGVRDEAEPTLSGWTMNLAGPKSRTEVTGEDGIAMFPALVPGTHVLSETLQSGWEQTALYCLVGGGEQSVEKTGTTFDVEPGSSIECFVGNRRIPATSITSDTDTDDDDDDDSDKKKKKKSSSASTVIATTGYFGSFGDAVETEDAISGDAIAVNGGVAGTEDGVVEGADDCQGGWPLFAWVLLVVAHAALSTLKRTVKKPVVQRWGILMQLASAIVALVIWYIFDPCWEYWPNVPLAIIAVSIASLVLFRHWKEQEEAGVPKLPRE